VQHNLPVDFTDPGTEAIYEFDDRNMRQPSPSTGSGRVFARRMLAAMRLACNDARTRRPV
jgi:hypothetical protein